MEGPLTGERAALVTLHGDLNLVSRDALYDALPTPGSVERVVIDCSAVTSVESVVIGAFMRYRRKFIAAGRDPLNIIFIVSPSVKNMFEIAGMSTFFTVIPADQRDL